MSKVTEFLDNMAEEIFWEFLLENWGDEEAVIVALDRALFHFLPLTNEETRLIVEGVMG